MSLTKASKLFSFVKACCVTFSQVNNYAYSRVSRPRNILRNRYNYRNPDGSYKVYNESITFIPKEFEKQGKLLSIIHIHSAENRSLQKI